MLQLLEVLQVLVEVVDPFDGAVHLHHVLLLEPEVPVHVDKFQELVLRQLLLELVDLRPFRDGRHELLGQHPRKDLDLRHLPGVVHEQDGVKVLDLVVDLVVVPPVHELVVTLPTVYLEGLRRHHDLLIVPARQSVDYRVYHRSHYLVLLDVAQDAQREQLVTRHRPTSRQPERQQELVGLERLKPLLVQHVHEVRLYLFGHLNVRLVLDVLVHGVRRHELQRVTQQGHYRQLHLVAVAVPVGWTKLVQGDLHVPVLRQRVVCQNGEHHAALKQDGVTDEGLHVLLLDVYVHHHPLLQLVQPVVYVD